MEVFNKVKEVKIIEGKKYIEYDEERQQRKRFIVSVLFLFLLAGAIIALATATIILIKNKNVITSDPLIYGMNVHNFSSCQCTDSQGLQWSSTDKGFINEFFVGGPATSEFNLSKINGETNGTG